MKCENCENCAYYKKCADHVNMVCENCGYFYVAEDEDRAVCHYNGECAEKERK